MAFLYGLIQQGEIVSFLLTPANTAAINHQVLISLLKELQGKCCGEKGGNEH